MRICRISPRAPLPPKQQSPSGRSAADIVSDNLHRVAGTAEQILEVLNKDSRLMVEFKRLFAEDAGNGGQILEESDLSDGAIGERLRQDPSKPKCEGRGLWLPPTSAFLREHDPVGPKRDSLAFP